MQKIRDKAYSGHIGSPACNWWVFLCSKTLDCNWYFHEKDHPIQMCESRVPVWPEFHSIDDRAAKGVIWNTKSLWTEAGSQTAIRNMEGHIVMSVDIQYGGSLMYLESQCCATCVRYSSEFFICFLGDLCNLFRGWIGAPWNWHWHTGLLFDTASLKNNGGF